MDLTPSVSSGPEGLRALTHPVRLRMLGMLRTDGPATATSLARRLGLNTGATSYHLRQLAQHGFIEDDPERGDARDRWWRAAHRATFTSSDGLDEEAQDAQGAYQQAVTVLYAQQLQRATERQHALPPDWRQAGTMSDWVLRLTPARAEALVAAIVELVQGWEEEDQPEAKPFSVNLNAFLHPDTRLDHELDPGPGTGPGTGQDTGPGAGSKPRA